MNDPAKILVVDDEQPNLLLMKARLSPMGYELYFAQDGLEALEQVRQVEPDVILLDLIMPKLDGFEVARRLKSDVTYQRIPIIVVSGSGDEKSRVKAINTGIDDFLSKPVSLSELQARIKSSLKVKAYHDHMKNHQQKLEATVAKRTQELEKANERIRSGSLETIHRLTTAAEYKDEDTGNHIKRMSNYAVAIARQLGFKEKPIERLLHAAPLHDIGKIGIPDSVLLKPGKLNSDEWALMQQHTLFGGKILQGSTIDYLRLGKIIAMNHHEKWDGSGYPYGLKGKQIPFFGRITAIADVFDALTTKRPYKEAFSLESSLAIIEEGSGSHFDPRVVEAFFSVQEVILTIREKYQDIGFSPLFELSGEATTPTGVSYAIHG